MSAEPSRSVLRTTEIADQVPPKSGAPRLRGATCRVRALPSSPSVRGRALLPLGVASRPIRLPRHCRRDWHEVFTATGLSAAARTAVRALCTSSHLRLHRERGLQPGEPGLGSEAGVDWKALCRRSRTRVPPEPSHCEGTARERRCRQDHRRGYGDPADSRHCSRLDRDPEISDPDRSVAARRATRTRVARSRVIDGLWLLSSLWLNVARSSRTGECLASTVPPHAMPHCDVQLPQRSSAKTNAPARTSASLITPAEQANYPGRKSNRWPTKLFARCGILVHLTFQAHRYAPLVERHSTSPVGSSPIARRAKLRRELSARATSLRPTRGCRA